MVSASGFRSLAYLYGGVCCVGSLLMIITAGQMMQHDRNGYNIGSILLRLSVVFLIMNFSLFFGIWKRNVKFIQLHLEFVSIVFGLALVGFFGGSIVVGSIATDGMKIAYYFIWLGVTAVFFILITFTTIIFVLTWWILKGVVNSIKQEAFTSEIGEMI